jgi:hypothetical protein
VFYLGNSDSERSDEENILKLGDLNCIRRKIILISEIAFKIPDFLSDSVFIFIPPKSSMWRHNFTLLLYSVEFLFYDHYSKSKLRSDHKGKIENYTRISAQTYLKFMSQLIESYFSTSKYSWILECPIGRMLLNNYIMSYYFLSWVEYNQKNTHLECPISKLFPLELISSHDVVYKFLESLTGTH